MEALGYFEALPGDGDENNKTRVWNEVICPRVSVHASVRRIMKIKLPTFKTL